MDSTIRYVPIPLYTIRYTSPDNDGERMGLYNYWARSAPIKTNDGLLQWPPSTGHATSDEDYNEEWDEDEFWYQ